MAGVVAFIFHRDMSSVHSLDASSQSQFVVIPPPKQEPETIAPIPPLPPKSVSDPWVNSKDIYPDSALFGLDSLIDLRALIAYPVTEGSPTIFENLADLDYLPSTAFTDSPIAIYENHEDWMLIHSKTGWFWLLCRHQELMKGRNYDPKSGILVRWENPIETTDQTVTDSNLESKGWVVYSRIRKLEPIADELLHVEPSVHSKHMGRVKHGLLRTLEFRGDWVKVQEPSEFGDVEQEKDREEIPLLKVRWNPSRIGWVRWKVPSSVPNRPRMLFRGSSEYGIID